MKVRVSEDLEECRRLWLNRRPECLFDMWWVREAFEESFRRPLHLIVAEERGDACGFLPLSWIEETGCMGYFPGETWRGRTWLEQNKFHGSGKNIIRELLEAVPEEAQLRYLLPGPCRKTNESLHEDEVGYLFLPGSYDYDFEKYRHTFSRKSRKQLSKEIAGLSSKGLSFRYDHMPDTDQMFRMNLEGFGEYSYFSDTRFLTGFEALIARLHQNEMLRIVTVLIGGKIAAVDVAAIWKNSCTVLAGGTSSDFPGVAKLINFHHLEWACREHIDSVDFLCGDFGWKRRFHLTPRPLYELRLFGKNDALSEAVCKIPEYA